MKDKLGYFHQLDDIDQDIREYEIEARKNSAKALSKLEKLRDRRKNRPEEIGNLTFEPKSRYCYVHFEL